MGSPYLSEIKIWPFAYAPRGWALCNGQIMSIQQNVALFSLLGTVFGGNGQTTFGLPNLQGSVPIHMGNGFTLGQVGGEQNHTLSVAEIPSHTHAANASNTAGGDAVPTGNILANTPALIYAPVGSQTSLSTGTIGSNGGTQPHQNMQPYLTLNFTIALQGVFPSRS